VRYEVLKAVTRKMVVFWCVTLPNLVDTVTWMARALLGNNGRCISGRNIIARY
jgi:hypothetical protein